ncbi:MAG: DNA-processing protein DprA [Desulfitobacteriaceae bacterium]
MEVYWLWLSMIKGVGPVTLRKLVQTLGTPLGVYKASSEELKGVPGVRQSVIEMIQNSRSLDLAKSMEEKMQQKSIKLLSFFDSLYPEHLNYYPSLPAILFYRGKLQSPMQTVGIIGSRRCTSYGKQIAAEAAEYLGRQGVIVVSGLAKGIDSYAHTACLKAGGYTLAFVANGPEICYPPEHHSLMDEIVKKGAIISPFPPGRRPKQEYFPLRNRLLSAWVDQLLIVEASERSGALITAQYAQEFNRPVYAVPNSIYVPESTGTNRLLENGAKIYLHPEQLIMNKLNTEKIIPKALSHVENVSIQEAYPSEISSGSFEEQAILNNLQEPRSITELHTLYPGNLNELFALLIQMELIGKVKITGREIEALLKNQ